MHIANMAYGISEFLNIVIYAPSGSMKKIKWKMNPFNKVGIKRKRNISDMKAYTFKALPGNLGW